MSAVDLLVRAIGTYGLNGIIISGLVLWLYHTQQQLRAENNARLSDAQEYTKLALELQEKVFESCSQITIAVDKLTMIVDSIRVQRGAK